MDLSLPQSVTDNLGGAGLIAVVLWWMWRSRNSDAAKQLADAFVRMGRLEQRIEDLEEYDRKHAAVLQAHAGWDSQAHAALPPDAAAELGPPPPLYPPEEA